MYRYTAIKHIFGGVERLAFLHPLWIQPVSKNHFAFHQCHHIGSYEFFIAYRIHFCVRLNKQFLVSNLNGNHSLHLTQCGLVMPYGDTDLGLQRQWGLIIKVVIQQSPGGILKRKRQDITHWIFNENTILNIRAISPGSQWVKMMM